MSNETSSDSNIYALYPYDPSIAASVVFIVCFTSIFIVKLVDYIRFCCNKASKFPFDPETPQNEQALQEARMRISVNLIPIYVGLLFEILGYILRAVSIRNSDNITIYIISTAMILFAPFFITSGVLMIFNTIDQCLCGKTFSLISTRFFSVLVAGGDIGCILLQGLGAMKMSLGSFQLGFVLTFVGLGIRVFLYALFIAVVTSWLRRMNRESTKVAQLMDMNESECNWRRFVQAIVVIMALVLVRSILTTSEFAENTIGKGYFSKSEVAFYLIHAVLIFWSSVILVALRPEYCLWEIQAYQIWIDLNEEGRKCSDIENATVVWRRTSWIYN